MPGAIVEWIETAVGHRSNGNPSPACSPASRLLPCQGLAAAVVAALAVVAIQVPAADAAGPAAVDSRQVAGERQAPAAACCPGRIAIRSKVADLTVVVEVLVVLRFPLSVSIRQWYTRCSPYFSLDGCRFFLVTYPDNNIARQAYHNQFDLAST